MPLLTAPLKMIKEAVYPLSGRKGSRQMVAVWGYMVR